MGPDKYAHVGLQLSRIKDAMAFPLLNVINVVQVDLFHFKLFRNTKMLYLRWNFIRVYIVCQ